MCPKIISSDHIHMAAHQLGILHFAGHQSLLAITDGLLHEPQPRGEFSKLSRVASSCITLGVYVTNQAQVFLDHCCTQRCSTDAAVQASSVVAVTDFAEQLSGQC